jgi:hypothetical protein
MCEGQATESTTYCQWKPSNFYCCAQSIGSCGVSRINFLAVSCGGFLPLMMAVMMSGASEGSRSRQSAYAPDTLSSAKRTNSG